MLLNVNKRGHKRAESETSTIKQRGRAKQRPPPIPASNPEDSFDALPSGFPAAKATEQMNKDELTALGEQAIGQAIQFEVLATTHVKALSRVSVIPIHSNQSTLANDHRNSALLTNVADTSELPTDHSAPDERIYTTAYATTFGHHELPNSPSIAC